MFAPRRAANDEHAASPVRILVGRLRAFDGFGCGYPVDGEVIVRIAKARPRLAGSWTLAGLTVTVPRRHGDGVKFALDGVEGWIGELRLESSQKFLLGQCPIRRTFARLSRARKIVRAVVF